MKLLLMGLMLLMTATAASAEWTRVDHNDLFIQYVDRATIRSNGNFVKMWDLMDYKTVQKSAAGRPFLSDKSQSEYDCKKKKSRLLAFTWFDGKMGNGKVVVSNGNVRAEWSPVGPGSMGEALWEVACGKN